MLLKKLLIARETALQFIEAVDEIQAKWTLYRLELDAIKKLHIALGNHVGAMNDLLKELTGKNEQQKKGNENGKNLSSTSNTGNN